MISSGLPRGGQPTQRPRARHRGLFWLATVIALFALLGGSYLAVSTYMRSAEPADVVTSYFTALSQADGPRALSYGPVPSGDHAYLTEDVLRQQLRAGAISNVQVLSVSKGHSTAQVSVNYQLRDSNGQQRLITDVVPMIRKDRHWWLAQSAVTTKVSLIMAGHRATFAGTAMPSGSVVLFPGALPISFDTPNMRLAPAHSTVQFNVTENAPLSVEATVVAISAMRSAVGTALTSCLTAMSKDALSKDALCPVPTTTDGKLRVVPGSVRGTIAAKAVDALTITVSTDPDGIL